MTVSRDIIVVGASAGGLAALIDLVRLLPPDLPASTFLVLHRPETHALLETLPDTLSRKTALRVLEPFDGQRIQAGTLYIAPSDRHLVLENGAIRLERSPKEGRFRPSINVLFRSAAAVYGRRVIGVLLSGMLDDGTAGLWQIKKRGGVVLVQDPTDAAFSSMPLNAIGNVSVDYVLPASAISQRIVALAQPKEAVQSRQSKILIVEDERLVAKNLQAGLQELGYAVSDSVASGEAAVRSVCDSPPDLILMDIRLDGSMSGIEAARRIWQGLQIPVVYITAYADEKTLRQVQRGECYGYVVKPFHTPAIHAAIQLALDRREREVQQGTD